MIEIPLSVRQGDTVTVGIPRIPLEAFAIIRRVESKGNLAVVGVEFTARHNPANRDS